MDDVNTRRGQSIDLDYVESIKIQKLLLKNKNKNKNKIDLTTHLKFGMWIFMISRIILASMLYEFKSIGIVPSRIK